MTTIRRKITTRTSEGIDEDGNTFLETPIIDEDLQLLAWSATGIAKFSGQLVTVWHRGGLREPQGLKKEQRAAIAARLKAFLPHPGFSGKIIFHLNSGEMSGLPKILG